MNRKAVSIAFLFGFILFSLSSGCKKSDDSLPFRWVKLNNSLKYDYISGTDTLKDALTISVIKNPQMSNLRFRYEHHSGTIDSTNYIGEDYNVYAEEDGLYTSAYEDCSFGSLTTFRFMRAPDRASLHSRFPDYLCRNNIKTTYILNELDILVETPAGVFSTYILVDSVTNRHEYWDAMNGLIKIELYSKTDSLLGEYVLTSKNYQ